MKNSFIELNKKFLKIKEQGWIECKHKGDGSAGRLFEELIGNPENSFEIPDFKGIEIKTKYSKIEKFTTLFSYRPEGKYILESQRIKDTFGYPDKDFPSYNVLNACIYCNRFTHVNENYLFFPTIDKQKKKIILNIFDINLNLVENDINWDFDIIEEKVNRKIKYLAFINADRKYEFGKVFYKFNNISFYKFKGIDSFLKQFEKGNIRITFKLNIYKHGIKKGQIHDHGTSFDLRNTEINSVYELIK